MTIKDTRKIRCPVCGKESDFEIYGSINTELDPDLKERVLDGTVFLFKCPDCGHEAYIVYPCLYHQMEDRLMIYLVKETEVEEAREAFEKGEGELAEAMSGLTGYSIRIVNTQNSLREKIKIFDAGRDDRVIELIKLFYFVSFKEKMPDREFEELLYDDQGDEAGILYFMNEGQVIGTVTVPAGMYAEIEEKVRQWNDEYKDDPVIDLDWANISVNKGILAE